MRTLFRWLVIVLALIGTVATVAAIAGVMILRSAEPEKTRVHKGDYLIVDFDRGIAAQPPRDALDSFSLGRAYVLADLITALRRGAADPRIAGVAAHLGGARLAPATAQELAEAIADFKKVGKTTLLFSESLDGGPGAAALASAFQQVWLQPSGLYGLRGLALETPFLRSGLAEYGIRAEIVQRQEYKSAMDFLSRDDMAPPVRENIGALVSDIADSLNQSIAAARGLTPEAVQALAARGPLLAADAKTAGLVDALGYQADFQAAVKAAFPGGALPAEAYAATAETPNTDIRLALIQAAGQIVPGETEFDPLADRAAIGAATIAQAIRDAVKAKGVRAIVLRLETPGGDYAASDTIRQAIAEARAAGRPVIVSMGNVAASGGYFIATAAETVIAEPATITGSIGVIAGKIVLEDAWRKLGVHWNTLSTGETAAMWSPNHGFSPAERARLEAVVDAAYADFTTKVGEARKLTPEALDKAARGRVFSGKRALELGLVDDTGGLLKALAYAKRAAGIPADQIPAVVSFPQPRSLAETLRSLIGGDGKDLMQAALPRLPEPLATLSAWSRLKLERGAAIMPPIAVR